MPDPTHINPHLDLYIRGETHGCPGANPPVLSTLQEFRRKVDLGCYTADMLDDLLDELVEFVTEWVAENDPLED